MMPPDDFDPPAGVAQPLEPGLSRILAPNPSPMTYRGTNTYLLGTEEIAVIDPGPESESHLAAILEATKGRRIAHIVVTHAHLDHSPLAAPLARATGAPICAFGTAAEGRSPVMQDLAGNGMVGGGEGIDHAFDPDIRLGDGDVVEGGGWRLEALHTPGHIGNHLCLAWGDACFTADHVMGWATSLVSPPDGDLTDFMASCRRLQTRDWRVFYPGHGGQIDDPGGRLAELIRHREGRETAIRAALADGPATAKSLARIIYTDTPAALLPAAERNVLAHLIDLTGRSLANPDGALTFDAVFRSLEGVTGV